MHRTSLIALILATIIPLAASVPAVASGDASFAVIVHPEVEGAQIPRATLSSLFLKDVVRWGDGLMVRPVDHSLQSPLREAFTRQVLTVPVAGVQRFWQAKIMKGITPPPVKSSDADVVEYVAMTKGAIGYVSTSVPVPTSVKVLAVID